MAVLMEYKPGLMEQSTLLRPSAATLTHMYPLWVRDKMKMLFFLEGLSSQFPGGKVSLSNSRAETPVKNHPGNFCLTI